MMLSLQREDSSLLKIRGFLPSTPFPKVTVGTSWHSLEHTSQSCSDICKALGSLPPGNRKGSLPICGLAFLIYSCLHLCLCCVVLFCLFSTWPNAFYSWGCRVHPTNTAWAALGLGKRTVEPSTPSFGYESESGRLGSPFLSVKGWEETNYCATIKEWCHKEISSHWSSFDLLQWTYSRYNSLLKL